MDVSVGRKQKIKRQKAKVKTRMTNREMPSFCFCLCRLIFDPDPTLHVIHSALCIVLHRIFAIAADGILLANGDTTRGV